MNFLILGDFVCASKSMVCSFLLFLFFISDWNYENTHKQTTSQCSPGTSNSIPGLFLGNYLAHIKHPSNVFPFERYLSTRLPETVKNLHSLLLYFIPLILYKHRSESQNMKQVDKTRKEIFIPANKSAFLI